MKIKFYCDSGANIHSCKIEEFDTVEDYDMEDEEWEALSDDEKYKLAEEWAWNSGLQIGWEKAE